MRLHLNLNIGSAWEHLFVICLTYGYTERKGEEFNLWK